MSTFQPAYRPWSPSATDVPASQRLVGDSEPYVGRHRRAAKRRLAIFRLFYIGRHRIR